MADPVEIDVIFPDPIINDVVIEKLGPAGVGIPSGGTTSQRLAKASNTDFDTHWVDAATASVDWGDVGGTLSNQIDLQAALDAKQNSLGFTPENVANKDTDGTLAANSDTKYPSQKATKTYVDGKASSGANPSATVSGSAVNGSAVTFMRSDAAPALANTAVTAASYGAANKSPSFTVDAQGRLTAAADVTITPSAIGAVLTTTTVNGHALSSNVTVTDTDLGATTVGDAIFKLTNPSAITFLRINADNSATALSDSAFRTAIGAGTGSGDALTANPLSQFAATTSAQLRGVLSDENGTGAALFDGATSPTFVTPILGTPTSGNLANCTFPTLNQNTTGSAASLSISGQTGLLTFAGLTSTNRAKTVRDAADTILELGGSYTPTGTWTSLPLTTPKVTTSIQDANANSMLAFTATASSIFGFTLTNAASGGTVALGVTTPTQAASGIAGTPLSVAASNAVAGSSVNGAVAGGGVTIQAGNAARLVSGNANGGNINLTTGSSIGTGTQGRIIVPDTASNGAGGLIQGSGNTSNGIGFSSGNINLGGWMNLIGSQTNIRIPSTFRFGWSSSSNDIFNNALDTAFYRNAAGVVEIDNGTAGTFADLKLRKLTGVQTAAGTVTSTYSLDVTLGRSWTMTTTASTALTITPTAAGTADQIVTLIITSDATGGDVVTFASPFKPSGTMTLTASKVHTIQFISDGTNLYELSRTTGL